jgi:hypothetical protein
MNWFAILVIAPFCFCSIAWIIAARSTEKLRGVAKAALIATSLISGWAALLYLQHFRHPEYASLPPWKDPINLDAGLLVLLAPIGVILGLFAAGKKSPWWLVLLVELASLQLLLVGCAAAASV